MKTLMMMRWTFFLLLSLFAQSALAAEPRSWVDDHIKVLEPLAMQADKNAELEALYGHLDPERMIPDDLLLKAVKIYHSQDKLIRKKEVLTVIDYGKNSKEPRFYLVNMISGAVEAMHVAHGRGSDPDFDGFAQKFSNTPDSLMTSLGAFVTAETYIGEHGKSLRLDGISSTNSKARERAIVIHGAEYVTEEVKVQGRSYGCPALPTEKIDRVIKKIGGGSLIFAGVSGAK